MIDATPIIHDQAAQGNRSLIRLEGGRLHEIASEAEGALIQGGAPFYAHGDVIKRPVVDEVRASRGRTTKVARLALATPEMLRDHLSRAADWEKFDARRKKWVPADPPRDVASVILSRDGEWRLRRIVGVITTPTLRPDGSVLRASGYDETTRLVLLDPPPMPGIPEVPTRDHALRALVALMDLLKEFPFVDLAGRSVALSALITPVVRGALTVAPLHAVTAPAAGTGKSFLLDTASAIATGQICPVIAAGATEEEMEKRLAAALMKGQPIISIDNLNGELSGDFLCQAVERPVVEPRLLGASKNVRIESHATIFANGNNLRVAGDMVRRTIVCRLDANMERPELRTFAADPVGVVLANRGKYVAAALTICRAYIAAGCPNAAPALASFEDWSRVVRSALIWLGLPDPVATMDSARADDPETIAIRQVFDAWRDAVGTDCPMTTGEIKELAERKERVGSGDYHDPGEIRLANPDLRSALIEIAPGKGEIDTRRLGRWLGRYRGRVLDGVKLTASDDSHSKQARWYLVKAGG